MSRPKLNPPNAKRVSGGEIRGERMHRKCPRCDGMGKSNGFDCALCGGRGHIEEMRAKVYIATFDETIPYWNQDDHRREEG